MSFTEKLLEKLLAAYFWPAEWLVKKLCTGGPHGLPLLLLSLVIVPPIFWLSLLALCVILIALVA